MELVEIRDLDGPNIFLLEPAIKIEFKVTGEDRSDLAGLTRRLGIEGPPSSPDSEVAAALATGNQIVIDHVEGLKTAIADLPAAVAARLSRSTDWTKDGPFAGALVEGDAADIQRANARIAGLPGPLVLVQAATTDELGKTAGKDLRHRKGTYPALLGIEGARARGEALAAEAREALVAEGIRSPELESLARFVVSRRS